MHGCNSNVFERLLVDQAGEWITIVPGGEITEKLEEDSDWNRSEEDTLICT